MFKNRFPNFKEGNILKQDMLENLRDYPRNFFKLYFQDYSDGILVGSGLSIEEDCICINKGIIKFKGIIYLLDEVNEIYYSNTNKEVLVKVKFPDCKKGKDFKVYNSEVFLDENTILAEDEFELGRFKLREGAKLRATYDQFSDFSTEYNTVNIINVKYSNIDTHTLHPLIIKKFAKKLLKESQQENLDIPFAMECLNSRVVNRDLIINYLIRRLDLRQKKYTNLEIYNHMKRIVKRLTGRKTSKRRVKNRSGKIIVD